MSKHALFPLLRIGLMLTGLFTCCFLPARAENYQYRSDVLWVTTPDHSNWIYTTGEKAAVTVSVYLYGILQEEIEIAYSSGPEQFPDDTKGSIRTKNG